MYLQYYYILDMIIMVMIMIIIIISIIMSVSGIVGNASPV